MNDKKIITVAKELNAKDFVSTKVDLSLKGSELKESFMTAIEELPVKYEKNIPKAAVDMYNTLATE